jgi:hypothetical protein
VLSRLPHEVEPAHPDPVDDLADEALPAVVLRDLLVETDRALDPLLDAANLPPRLEGPLELRQGGDVLGPDLVHHVGGVSLQEGHHRLRAVEDRPLLRGQQPEEAPRARSRLRLLDGALQLVHELVRIERHGPEVLVDHAPQERAEPGGGRELHPVRHLVDRDPQPEVRGGERVPALRLDQVRADEVDQPLVVRREEHVVLAQDAPRHVAEDRARLGPHRLACDRGSRRAALQQPLRERLHQPLETTDVLSDPIAAAHRPGARAEPRDVEIGERGHELLRAEHVSGEILPHPRPILGRHGRACTRDALAQLDRHVPVGETSRV